ncbi:MAG: hypothetical protein IJH84_04665 [Saccharopolyspora sp.]|uniref:hypothetical protein n=1 Tax=Saccharopolyspora TaxID=1835 RepID=UPI0019097B4A|nr:MULTISPECIES: hypothetical protein [unclassified Saccharopolyspora]MBK0869967.1 hypothetical protein [Saccharopolyspora sp. HNM0986]MBQ6640313.1 hypothetical protein [Saccharopolyspora sp.]
MASSTELSDAQRLLGQLRSSVGVLRTRYGNAAAVRRLSNDVERLEIDLSELSALPAPRTETTPGDTVLVPDTPYDRSLWQDSDDEGVGGWQPH